MSETLNEERLYGSKQAYLTISLPETIHLRDGSGGTWSIEDEGKILRLSNIIFLLYLFLDGFKICDGELNRQISEQILLDYIPRDKQIANLKYELVICDDDKCSMLYGEVQPINQTDSIIEFIIKVDQTDNNSN